MATVSKWNPFGVALDLTATAGTVTRTSATQFTVVINASWECYYSGGSTNFGMKVTSGGKTIYIPEFDGDKYKSSGSGSLTGTYSISGNGSQTKSISVEFDNYKDSPAKSAKKSIALSVNVPAWTSYTIKYNANGGSGAPGNQTKWKDQTLTLSSTKPTRAGHDFLGWSTSSTATSATYASGASYTANAAATLYAVWKADTYQVTFNANGGTGAPAAQTKTYGKTLTLSSTKPTRTNYNFLGWGTSASSTTVTYAAGGSYTANAGATLYAVWELAYSKPRITNLSVKRCDGSENITDEGNCALVTFNWACDKAVVNIQIVMESATGSQHATYSVSASGTSGSVRHLIGGAYSEEETLHQDASYIIQVIVTDSVDSYSKSVTLNGLTFPIDVLAGGNGIAFGKPAELANHADFYYRMLFKQNTGIYGRNPDGDVKEAFNPQNANGNTIIGYGNYDAASGNTNIYGHDINFGVSNIATPGSYRPYRRKGDTMAVTIRTAGFVTGSSKEVHFTIPLSEPIIGSPTVSATSGQGFILRQGDSYTHGSGWSNNTYVYAVPTSYTVERSMLNGIYVKAIFSDTTNSINNAPVGIYWNGTITFS